MIEYNTINTL